ncbi:Copper amine oxidase 1 [Escovopsis weberi]|uniref:Amine oxidase n=1 Tax=Escovopsis weberi TaxID=150374 RepID=A0A0M8N6L3_ESCWE|nr:Copper amine oxidase 1 [Escovopsis weberi]
MVPFLEAEHAGELDTLSERPPRLALAQYSVINPGLYCHFTTVVHINAQAIRNSNAFQEAMSEFALPEGFQLAMDSWPFGGRSEDDVDDGRYWGGLVFAKPVTPVDSNYYAYPIPITVMVDARTMEVIRVERFATGGVGDGLRPSPRRDTPRKLFEDHRGAEYLPENICIPLRSDLKPIHITQPKGASFRVHSDRLIEWQKWSFRLGFNAREGAVLHDVCYDGRPIFYRLSFSEMTVPYADPRPPFQRKQAFDFGDVGVGRTANNLQLGCDCLGAIHYVDAIDVNSDGSPQTSKTVVCIHEQDNGILWKHTDVRTNRSGIVRNREFIVQFIATLGNYEYILSYTLDLAGGISMETRATGIVSVAAIDLGKTSEYGNVVSPGILAQNHQHIFAARIDAAIDSYETGDTRVVVEDSVGRKICPDTNPYGNLYEVERKPVDEPTWIDLEPRLNRLIKLENTRKKNHVSGRHLAYKVVAPVTQLLLADDDSMAAKRARFAQHHLWVTGHRDGELYAAGDYTNMSSRETGGVSDMIKRPDRFAVDELQLDEDDGHRAHPIVWVVFGLTHNPRVEDWPVM